MILTSTQIGGQTKGMPTMESFQKMENDGIGLFPEWTSNKTFYISFL
jgi:hypothetical protein